MKTKITYKTGCGTVVLTSNGDAMEGVVDGAIVIDKDGRHDVMGERAIIGSKVWESESLIGVVLGVSLANIDKYKTETAVRAVSK